MGYQLLTFSPTGQRRRGTGALELRLLFESQLTVSSVFEPLQCCRAHDVASDVVSELNRLDFDVAGVLQSDSTRVVGWIDRCEVGDGACSQWMRAIEPDHVVSDSTPLSSVLHVLALQPWAFVIAGHGVAGIITRADLQKPPVRAVLFGLLSLLEIHLTHWINEHYTADSWRDLLKPNRVVLAENLLRERAKRNEEISLLDCLQLADKKVVVASTQAIRNALGLRSKKRARETLERAERLRDRVAHSQDLVTEESWKDLSDTVYSVEQILAASDEAIESQKKSGASSKLKVAF